MTTVDTATDQRDWKRPPGAVYVRVRQTTSQGLIWRTIAWARNTGREWEVRFLNGQPHGRCGTASSQADAEEQLDAITQPWRGGLA